jgi:hypothetical protein
LDYIIKSTARFIKKKNRDYEYEGAVIKNMKRLVRMAQSHQDLQEVMIDFREDIKRIYKNPYQRITLEYFDILAWLNDKIKDGEKRLKSA